MIQQIAHRTKDTRDKYWIQYDDEVYVVNRTKAVAFSKGIPNGNEECYMFIKFARTLGLNYKEHHPAAATPRRPRSSKKVLIAGQ